MKHTHRIAALLLALLLLALAGCGKEEALPDRPTEGPTATTKTAETVEAESVKPSSGGFTLDDLTRENAVSTLVSAYRNVQMLRYDGGTLSSESYYFGHGGETVRTRRTVDPEVGEACFCDVQGVGYYLDGDHLQFSCYLDEDAELLGEDDFEYDVSDQMLRGTVENIESAGEDLWRFEIRDKDLAPDAVCRCTATKQTLTLKTIEWDYGDGSGSRVELRHGEAAQTKDFGMLQNLDKPTRKVTCVYTLHDAQGRPTTDTYSVETPYNAEPLFVHSRGLNFYLDEGLTKAYDYPGDGVDYTVYATDAMG